MLYVGTRATCNCDSTRVGNSQGRSKESENAGLGTTSQAADVTRQGESKAVPEKVIFGFLLLPPGRFLFSCWYSTKLEP